MTSMSPTATSALAFSIVAGSLVAEDAATLSAASFAAMGVLPVPLAFVAALMGIWIGDCALYGLARGFGKALLEKKWARGWIHHGSAGRIEAWFRRRGAIAVLMSRLFPGTRLPISLTAGFVKMPAVRFASAAVLGAATWVLAAFYLVKIGGARFAHSPTASGIFGIALAVGAVGLPRLLPATAHRARRLIRRLAQWEFWPAWLFYFPVPFMCAWLALRYRGLAQPACANPAQRNGGLIGESKIEILRELMRAVPENVAGAFPLPPAPLIERFAALEELATGGLISLPFVLKPDVGQRGEGFKKITSMKEARDYLQQVSAPLIAQRYAPGPREIGVFYYRFPGEARGHILAITDKQFPSVSGDGRSTLEELVRADARAENIADTYLKRFAEARDTVIPAGTEIRLVEAGNHCQGCIFRDGTYLYSDRLLSAIDGISQALPGFFIGRYDLRFHKEEDLRDGKFTIIELNGAASEATSIYDSRNSLWSAYRMLHRQWRLVYAIGAANRARGCKAPRLLAIFSDWLNYRRMAAVYPLAD